MASYVFNPFTGALTPASGGGSGLPTTGGTLTGDLTLNAQSDLRFADSDSSHFIALQAPATITSNVTLTLPAADGTNGQVLTTNGTGTLSFTTAAGGGGDIISEGNTSAEVIDTGSDGHFKVTTEGSERARIDSSGRLLVGTTSAGSAGNNNAHYANFIVAGNTYDNTFGRLAIRTKTAAASITAGTVIGDIFFAENGAGEFAGIIVEADGTAGANDYPGRLVFSTTADGAFNATEAMRINNQREVLIGTTTRNANGGILQLSSGITFPATAVAATDVNTLDDYEEGTWTPSLGGTTTYTTQAGQYTKVGRLVYVSFQLDVNLIGTGSNSRVSGLPFTGSFSGQSLPVGSFSNASSTLNFITARVSSNQVHAYGNSAAGTSITEIGVFQNSTQFYASGYYLI